MAQVPANASDRTNKVYGGTEDPHSAMPGGHSTLNTVVLGEGVSKSKYTSYFGHHSCSRCLLIIHDLCFLDRHRRGARELEEIQSSPSYGYSWQAYAAVQQHPLGHGTIVEHFGFRAIGLRSSVLKRLHFAR